MRARFDPEAADMEQRKNAAPDIVTAHLEARVDRRGRGENGTLRQRHELQRAGGARGGDEHVRIERRRKRFKPRTLHRRRARVDQQLRLATFEVDHVSFFHSRLSSKSSNRAGTRRAPSRRRRSLNAFGSKSTWVTRPQRLLVASVAATSAAKS